MAQKSVWDALIDDPGEAPGLNTRSDYLLLIQARLHGQPGTNEDRAKHFGLPAEQVLDLMAGKIDKFGMPELKTIAKRIGVTAKV